MLENKPKIIDNHAHLNFSAFDQDREGVINRALEAGVWMINVGTQKDTSLKAVEIAETYSSGIYAIVGLHPVHTSKSFHDESELGEGGREFVSRGEIFDDGFYRSLLENPKVVGVGECGLDYFRVDIDTKQLQTDNFSKQIKLAVEFDKPLMLHIRPGKEVDSPYVDAINIINHLSNSTRGNVHFFAGTISEAKMFLDLGFYLSFTGVITFANNYRELVEYIPLDRLLLETDCPYVSPVPFRGKRNEPSYVFKVAEKIAEWKNIDLDEVLMVTNKNSRKLFNI